MVLRIMHILVSSTITPGDITKEIVKVDENGNESGKADNVISNIHLMAN